MKSGDMKITLTYEYEQDRLKVEQDGLNGKADIHMLDFLRDSIDELQQIYDQRIKEFTND